MRLLDRIVDAGRQAHIAMTVLPDPVEASLGTMTVQQSYAARRGDCVDALSNLYSRGLAMSIPTLRRARNLHCSLVASLPLTLWQRMKLGEDPRELEPYSWMERPDPDATLEHILAWTTDDLLFHGRAFWKVTGRYPAQGGLGFPASFKRMPKDEVTVGRDGVVRWKGVEVAPADVIPFVGITDGVLCDGGRAITTALQLEEAAERYADVDIPAGFLAQTGGEPLTDDEALDLVNKWQAARRQRTTAYVPENVEFHESASNPERLQLVEARQHSALEMARLMDTPPWTVGAPSNNSLTYTNGQQSRADLIDFGTRQFIDVIEATLSGPNVTPRGEYIRLDLTEWLRNPFNEGTASGGSQNRSGAAQAEASSPREIAELIQKIYLGVGKVLSADEARDIANRAGAGLSGGFNPEGAA